MLDRVLHWLGYGLCHQLPERSFFGGGVQAPVCARDTGIYVGFTIALIVIAFIHRSDRPRSFPLLPFWIVFAVSVAFMGWDGVTSYAGMRESNNVLRLVTGLGTGYCAATMIVPMLNDALWRSAGAGRLLSPAWKFLVWLAGIPLATLILWYAGPHVGLAYPLFIGAAIIVTLTAINLVLVGLLPRFDRRAVRLRDLLAPLVLAFMLTATEVFGSVLLRVGIVALTSR